MIRSRRLRPCDPNSIVQVTNTVKTKDMIKDFYDKKSCPLPSGSDSRSFDFPDGVVDFDAPRISEAPDLIEQSFMAKDFTNHLNPTPPTSPVPDPPSPPVDND